MGLSGTVVARGGCGSSERFGLWCGSSELHSAPGAGETNVRDRCAASCLTLSSLRHLQEDSSKRASQDPQRIREAAECLQGHLRVCRLPHWALLLPRPQG